MDCTQFYIRILDTLSVRSIFKEHTKFYSLPGKIPNDKKYEKESLETLAMSEFVLHSCLS